MATQISVLLENRPGALGDLASVMHKAGVNIEAIMLEGSVDFGTVRLQVSSIRKAEKVLKDAGYQYRVGEALVLRLPNEPGQLEEVCRKLAKAKINIDSLYGTTAAGSTEPELVLMVDDVEKARKALGVAAE